MTFVVPALERLRLQQTLVTSPSRLIAHVVILAVSFHPRLPAERSERALYAFVLLLHILHMNISEKQLRSSVRKHA